MGEIAKTNKRLVNQRCYLLNDADNETLFRMLGPGCYTLSSGVVQLLESQPPDNTGWLLKCSGVACFVKDFRKKSYFIRMFDVKEKKMLWEHELYKMFKYNTPRDFFHTFESDTCQVGLNFASEDEAMSFRTAVNELLAQRRQRRLMRKSRKTSTGNTGHVKSPKMTPNPLSPVSPPLTTTSDYLNTTVFQGAADVVTGNVTKSQCGSKIKRGQKIKTEDISAPFNFRVVNRVAFDPNAGFNMDGIEEDMKILLQALGICPEGAVDMQTIRFVIDFINRNGGIQALQREIMDVAPPPSPASNSENETWSHNPGSSGSDQQIKKSPPARNKLPPPPQPPTGLPPQPQPNTGLPLPPKPPTNLPLPPKPPTSLPPRLPPKPHSLNKPEIYLHPTLSEPNAASPPRTELSLPASSGVSSSQVLPQRPDSDMSTNIPRVMVPVSYSSPCTQTKKANSLMTFAPPVPVKPVNPAFYTPSALPKFRSSSEVAPYISAKPMPETEPDSPPPKRPSVSDSTYVNISQRRRSLPPPPVLPSLPPQIPPRSTGSDQCGQLSPSPPPPPPPPPPCQEETTEDGFEQNETETAAHKNNLSAFLEEIVKSKKLNPVDKQEIEEKKKQVPRAEPGSLVSQLVDALDRMRPHLQPVSDDECESDAEEEFGKDEQSAEYCM